MSRGIKSAVVLALAVAHVGGHLAWNNPDLQPVQGLYVKPSSDGTTGDLYVAATEDSGVQSQWLTDQPINFLPAASQPQPAALPLFGGLSSNALPHDESLIATHKRAVVTPATKYSYGMPSGTPEASFIPYANAGVQSAKAESLTASEGSQGEAVSTPAAVPQYSPYHYMYPHMMHAAYANAMNKVLKEAGMGSEDASNSNTLTSYPAMWPTTSYYPMQYLMMDPTAWARSQAAAISASANAATTTSSPTSENPDS